MLSLIMSMLLALTLLWLQSTNAPIRCRALRSALRRLPPNGGNIIDMKDIETKALEKQGINNAEAIAAMLTGIGQMSGYAEALGEGNDVIVADWIWSKLKPESG